MKSLIPFTITLNNDPIRKYLFDNVGLQRNDILNIYFNDTIGKREFVSELLLSTILPREWSGIGS
jgi:hypothetical protein